MTKQTNEVILSQASIDLIQSMGAASATATERQASIDSLKDESNALKALNNSFADSVAQTAIQVADIEGQAVQSKVMAELLGEDIASGKVRKYWADGVKVYEGLKNGQSITIGNDESVNLVTFTNPDIESPKVSKVATAIRKADKERKEAINDALAHKVTSCEAFIESNGAFQVETIAGESLNLMTGEDCVSALNSGLLTDESMVSVLNAKRDGEDIINAMLQEQERLASIQASINALAAIQSHIDALAASDMQEAQDALANYYLTLSDMGVINQAA